MALSKPPKVSDLAEELVVITDSMELFRFSEIRLPLLLEAVRSNDRSLVKQFGASIKRERVSLAAYHTEVVTAKVSSVTVNTSLLYGLSRCFGRFSGLLPPQGCLSLVAGGLMQSRFGSLPLTSRQVR